MTRQQIIDEITRLVGAHTCDRLDDDKLEQALGNAKTFAARQGRADVGGYARMDSVEPRDDDYDIDGGGMSRAARARRDRALLTQPATRGAPTAHAPASYGDDEAAARAAMIARSANAWRTR